MLREEGENVYLKNPLTENSKIITKLSRKQNNVLILEVITVIGIK
jgi:hypothetical protein